MTTNPSTKKVANFENYSGTGFHTGLEISMFTIIMYMGLKIYC